MFPLMRDRDAAQVAVSLPVPRTLRPDAEGLVGALPEDHAGLPSADASTVVGLGDMLKEL